MPWGQLMSDGSKFAKKPLSTEERLSNLERRLDVILQRIGYYDNVLEEFSKIKNHLLDINQQIKEANQKNSSINSDIINNTNNTVRIKEYLDNKFLQIDKNIKDLNKNIKELDQFHIKNSSYLEEKISQLDKKPVYDQSAHERISFLSEQNKEFHKTINGINSEINRKTDPLNSKIEMISSQILRLITDREDVINRFNDFTRLNKDSSSKTSHSLKDEIATREGVLRCLINEKIDALREKLTSIIPDKSLKEEMNKKIDMVALDSSNAFLKSNNLSQQVIVLEKKIENINLLLKKYELNK